MSAMTLVAVLAHPDDESFAIGGTLAKYAAQGFNVDLVVATRGEAGIPGEEPRRTAEVREGELHMACVELGVRRLEFLGFTDGQLGKVPDGEAVRRLVERLRRSRPDVVVTFGPDGISGHPDHVAVSRWTTSAFDRLSQEPDGPRRLYYIVPSEATRQGCEAPVEAETVGGPVAFIEICSFRIAKVRAARQHSSQNPPFHERPEGEAQNLACHEVFRLVRPVRTDNGTEPEGDLFSGIGD
jgi:LmbE family N-acetylglucosaminyl deacetylase